MVHQERFLMVFRFFLFIKVFYLNISTNLHVLFVTVVAIPANFRKCPWGILHLKKSNSIKENHYRGLLIHHNIVFGPFVAKQT